MAVNDLEDLKPGDESPEPEKKPAKKTAAKKSAAKKSDSDVTAVAEEVLAGRWGNGRDRDERLKKAGHDPDAVRKEAYRIRGERIKNPES
jgi:CW_7 repeat